jgi:hypothetical protein
LLAGTYPNSSREERLVQARPRREVEAVEGLGRREPGRLEPQLGRLPLLAGAGLARRFVEDLARRRLQLLLPAVVLGGQLQREVTPQGPQGSVDAHWFVDDVGEDGLADVVVVVPLG